MSSPPPSLFFTAQCRREGRFWVIDVTGWNHAEKADVKVGTTLARVFRREIESEARELITDTYAVDEPDDITVMVFGSQLIPSVVRDRWQYHWPWAVTRPWLPRIDLGSDERGNESICAVIPPFGWFVLFFRRKLKLVELDEDEAEAWEAATPRWWAPTQKMLSVAGIPLYLTGVALAVRAIRRRRR